MMIPATPTPGNCRNLQLTNWSAVEVTDPGLRRDSEGGSPRVACDPPAVPGAVGAVSPWERLIQETASCFFGPAWHVVWTAESAQRYVRHCPKRSNRERLLVTSPHRAADRA
jgi:hypothetical protein